MANKRGGLSKREYAAKQAGGSLSYKTGKISVPVKKTATTKSVAPLVGAGPLQPGQTRQAPLAGPSLPGKVSPGYYDYSNNSVNLVGYKEPSSSSSSNRAKAATPVSLAPLKNTGSGETISSGTISSGTISAAKPTNFLSDLMGKVGQMWANNALSQAPSGAFLTAEQRALNRGQLQSDINSGLGIDTANATGPSALELALQKGSTPDQPTGYGPNGEIYYNNFDPASEGAMMFQSDFATPGTNFSRPGSETAYNQGQSPVDYGMKQRAAAVEYGSQPTQPTQNTKISRTPRQTTTQPTPTTIGGGSGTDLGSLIQAVVSHPDFQALQTDNTQDNTPVNNGRPGTRRQFLGNGVLSNGLASNGKLDSGLDGFSFGANPMDNEQNLINQLLGINTAQASEMPQQMSFGGNSVPVSAFQQSFAQGGLTGTNPFAAPNNATIAPTIQDSQVLAGAQNVRSKNTGNGGVAQQFSQGNTGGSEGSNPALDYQKQAMKGFSAQEKAQKKALNELLKSIRNQYSTKQTEGINQLSKAKQEDLLKLSGLFSFANQDPNSEQRIQYEQRANQDYANQQADFLSKLAAAQTQDISVANQNYQKSIADIMSQRNSAQYNIAQLLQKAQEDAASRSSRGSKTPKYQYAYDNNGQVTGTYTTDDQGNVYYNPVATPFQAKAKSQNLLEQLLGSGGLNLNGVNPQ